MGKSQGAGHNASIVKIENHAVPKLQRAWRAEDEDLDPGHFAIDVGSADDV